MGERTITEIIGWRPAGVPVQALERPQFETSSGAHRSGPPSVDDLLAWLVSHVDTPVNASFGLRACVSFWFHKSVVFHEGPTLLAALEAAVRAVDTAPQPSPTAVDGGPG